MPTVINTSTAATATAYSNQRKIDRCQNGVLWAAFKNSDGGSVEFWYSTDNGATFTHDAAGNIQLGAAQVNYTPHFSFFIDVDDYAHVVYKNFNDGYLNYVRGTPNAGRTAWTWSAATRISGFDASYYYPDLIAHREGTGWSVHVVYGQQNDFSMPVAYHSLSISSGGVVTDNGRTSLASSYSNVQYAFPSIDFNHTGDGKTVAGGTPHLYAAWSAGATGAGKGIRLKKATYSAGAWTWGTEREIDSTRFLSHDSRWMNCLFDGTRVVLVGQTAKTVAGANTEVVMYERDAADTTTTTRILLADPVANADFMFFGSSSYDGNGNVYLFGRNLDGANGTRLVHYRKWTRATTTLGAKVTVDATGNDNPWFSTKRGYSNARIEWIYTDGTASPFSVTYDAILLNTAPNAPVLVAPADASTENLAAGFTFDWTFSDPDAGDTQSAYAFRRKIVGAPSYEYWNAGTGLWQGTEVWNTGVGSEVTFAAGKWTNATSYQWSVATKDAAGVAGPYATDRTVTASQPAIVTVTAPSGTVTSSSRPPVTWSVSDPDGDAQETYQVKIESGAYGTTPGAGTAVLDSGEVSSVTARAWTPTADLTNGVTYRVFVRVKTAGQYSAWASTTFTLSLSPPAVPTFTLTDDPANGRVVVAVQGVDNLLTANQASLETDTTGWAAVANCTIARSTLHAADGSASLELSSVAAGNMTADTSTGVNGFPVVAGRQYTARAQHRAGATARTARIYITWYTAAGATISTSAVGDVVSSAANFNAMGSTTVVAPANAAFAAIRVEILATAAAAEKHYVDKIGVVPGTSTAWTRGGLAGSTRFTVERSDNAGVTFAAVRSGKEIAHDGAGSQAATVYDYEAAPFKAAQYRAKTTVEV